MSKIGAAFLTVLMLAVTPLAAAEAPHRIVRDGAWGCRDRADVFDLLFLGISASFDTKLAGALADGRCVLFNPGEDVVVVEPGQHGVMQVQRGGVAPAIYWTSARNVK
jgi:hypothetical protein